MKNNFNNEENNKEEENNIKGRMSKGEKYFWSTLILIFIMYITVSFVAVLKNESSSLLEKTKLKSDKSPILLELSDIINKNLSTNQNSIILNLKSEIKKINNVIDTEIDNLFEEVINKNTDTYLDFHYSIIGGYTELGNMAISEHSKLLTEKLLGNNFQNKLKEVDKKIRNSYLQSLEKQQNYIEEIAMQGVSLELNSKAVETIKNDIDFNLSEQKIKLGVLGTAISAKILTVISTKISAKTALKVSGKAATKIAGVGSSAIAGASAGLLCGPGAVICTPVGAVLGAVSVWFATDAIINTIDEHYNREKLKEEILKSINLAKQDLKDEYISILNPKIEEFSNQIQEKYKKKKLKDNF